MTAPSLADYDVVLINTSGGKDSQAMLDFVVAVAEAQGVPRSKLVAVHCDLGRVEWEGTRELAGEQVRHYGLRFIAVSRPQGDLLDHVEERGKWPSPAARYCTSDHKRGQVYRVLTRLVRELNLDRPARILNCLGLRAAESDKRAAKAAFERDVKASNGKRAVDTWLPIHGWTEAEVWERIRRSGVRHHWAYDAGMPRLSCCFCIFAPRPALLIAAQHNPELLDEYVAVEKRINHTFKRDLALVEIQAAVRAGERPEAGPIVWAQCA